MRRILGRKIKEGEDGESCITKKNIILNCRSYVLVRVIKLKM